MSNSNHNQYIQFWIRVADVIIPYRDPQCSEVLLYLSVFHFLFSMLNRSHAYFWSNCPQSAAPFEGNKCYTQPLRQVTIPIRSIELKNVLDYKLDFLRHSEFWSTDLHIYRKPCVQGTVSTAPHPGWINKRNC